MGEDHAGAPHSKGALQIVIMASWPDKALLMEGESFSEEES